MDYVELPEARPDMSAGLLNKPVRLRSGLLLGVLFLVAVIKWETAGWFLITDGIVLYPTVIAFHGITHALALSRPAPFFVRLRVILISHLLLLIGFLLQLDVGDGPGWLAIAQLFGWKWGNTLREHWWTEYPLLFNSLAFVPVAISWAFITGIIGRPSASNQPMEL
jgi:hypothetical protein